MYFPYLVARGEEANSLKDLTVLGGSSKVIPILQAFSDDDDIKYSYTALMKACRSLIEKKNKFILLVYLDDSLGELESISNFNTYCIRGYDYTDYANINFDENLEYALIHHHPITTINDNELVKYHIFMPSTLMFDTYINSFPNNKIVVLADAFIRHEPNRDYPRIDIFNSELPFTFKSKGYVGFGDFTILPYNSIISGQANANDITHVIHLTHIGEDTKLYVDHYLTTPSEEPDNSRRSVKTLNKVKPNISKYTPTCGINKLSTLISTGVATSLGMYKRIGIMHHIELINSIII